MQLIVVRSMRRSFDVLANHELFCLQNELFVLVTDQGFLTESSVVWETLSNVEGDGHFVDASFRTYRLPDLPTKPIVTPVVPVNSREQIDQE